MASSAVVPLTFAVESCVHGYHIYKNTWKPYHRECLCCSREGCNRTDPFAVAVMKGEDTVGHVPQRFSCATNLFLQSGEVVSCKIIGARRYSRDLPQGGVEIPRVYTFSGAPELVNKTKQRLTELHTQIKECSLSLDSLQAKLLSQTDSCCKDTPEERFKEFSHKAVDLDVVTDCSADSIVDS